MKHEESTLQTKRALSDALKQLIRQKPLSKITIADIITKCNFNRKTFYYHFTDIVDLLKWTLSQETSEIVKQFDLAIDFSEVILFVMEYVENNDYIINAVLDEVGSDAAFVFFYNDFLSMIERIIEADEAKKNIKLDEEYKKFACEFFCSAISGILYRWFKSKDKEDKEIVCERIYNTVFHSLSGILQTDSE